MEILLSRERSSMVSTWTEMVGFFQESSGEWVLGNCGHESIGSIYDLLTKEQLYAEDGIQIPDEINGVKVYGIEDGEYLQSEDIVFDDEVTTFNQKTIQKAIDYLESYDWSSHPEYETALLKIKTKVTA